MSAGYEISPLARLDLLDIWEYVADEFSIEIADRVIGELVDAFSMLSEQPEMGQVKPEYADAPIRCWVVGPSVIAYRPQGEIVEIARIVRAERDWSSVDTD